MNQIQTLFKNISWVTLTQVITSICAFLWTIMIARYLGVNDYGILSFAMSLTVLLGMGTDIGMSTLTAKEISQDRSRTKKYIKNIIPFKIVLSMSIFLFTGLLMILLGYTKLVIEVTLIMCIENIFMCMINFMTAIFQAHENQKVGSIGALISSILLVLFTIIVIFFDLGIKFVALSYALSFLIYLFYVSKQLNKEFGIPRFEIDLSFWKETAKKAIPFGLSIFFYTIYFSIDVVMIQFLAGDYATGIYNSAYKLISVFIAFYVIYNTVIFPLMSRLYIEDEILLKISFEQSVKYSLLILLPICIGIYFYSPYIIHLIYSDAYALASVPMQILTWTAIFMFINGVTTSLLNSIGKEFSVTKIYVIAAVFNISLNYIMIPIYSFNGAAITTVLSEILILILMMYSISKTPFKSDWSLLKTAIKLVIAGTILAIVLNFINVSLWIAIPIGLVVYIVALIITKSLEDTDKYIIKQLLGR